MRLFQRGNRYSKLLHDHNILQGTILVILFIFSSRAFAQERTITGVITSKDEGIPLAGVSVAAKGANVAVQTNASGKFSMKVPGGINTLVFTYIGYGKHEMLISKESNIAILLEPDVKQLNDVVVSGYTVQSKKDFTGSSSRIKSEQLENVPVQSFDQALAGQAAGVNMVQPSGVLNSTPVFRIRGINSITSGIYPLIIIDGIAAFTGTVGGNIGNNPLADINPNDIESIDILKDASATAIYGSRAANGVVVITTKKGKKGKTKVNYDAWVGVSSPYNLPKLLNAYDYVNIKNEAMVNAGKTPGYALQTRTDGNVVNTNWYDVAFHDAASHSHDLSFSGASDVTKYFVSFGYSNQQGIIRTNSFKHKVVRINLEHQLFKQLTLGSNISYSNSMNAGPYSGSLPGQFIATAGLGRMAYILPPNVAVYNEDGSYNIQDNVRVGYGANNATPASTGYVGTINAYNLQLILDKDNYTSESNSLTGNVFAEYALLKGLKFKSSYGTSILKTENISFQNPYHGDAGPSNGAATNVNNSYSRSDWVNTLSYNVDLGKRHHLSALAGYEEIYTKVSSWGAIRTGITDPYFTSYQGGFTTISATGNADGTNGFVSYFSNLNYNYDKRYLLSYSFRRDGYSGLPETNKYGNFSGGSIGWNISKEKFFEHSAISNVISSLKLRASYGEVGNINIGDYPALGLYNAGTYAGIATLGYSQAGNSMLKWEVSKKTDYGFNIGLFNDRITIDADYYNNTTAGLVLDARQAPSRGIPNSTISANVGSMYNRGFEFSIDGKIIPSGDLTWNANFNFSTLTNKVTALSSGADIYTPSNFGIQNMTRVGYSVGSIWAVPSTGINPDNGQRIFVNSKDESVQYNHAGTTKWTYLNGSTASAIDNYLDGKIQGPSLPTYYGGFNNSFSFKGFDLNIGITFSGGNYIYNGTRAAMLDQRYFNNGKFVMDRWTTPKQVTDVQKLVYGDNVSTGFSITHTGMVEDGSYVKFKNVSLGYRVPLHGMISEKISSMRVYLNATNLYTFTKYTGSDPEISVNGNSIASGKDFNAVPNARTVTLGLNLGF